VAFSYFSTVFEQCADRVWDAIRDFGAYEWAGAGCEASIEDGRPGDAVGSVRTIGDDGPRQRLLAHSDLDRSYVYEFDGSCPFPVENYRATIRITPIIDDNRAFVEWSASFDCDPAERAYWTDHFARSFAMWLGSLRSQLARSDVRCPDG
jgi:hypothetical protein